MKLEEIAKLLDHVPYMDRSHGQMIYRIITENQLTRILELGFLHGTTTCYMAAAIASLGSGQLTTIDKQFARDLKPNIHDLLDISGLTSYVEPVYSHESYNWELLKLIENQTHDGECVPIFDLCYLDGSHIFEVDCCAFMLVDKLLKPGGIMLFDDYKWTFSDYPDLCKLDYVQRMEEEERNTAQIKKLFDYIVRQHPNYGGFNTYGNWAVATKRSDTGQDERLIDLKRLHLQSVSPGQIKKLSERHGAMKRKRVSKVE